MNAVFSQNLQVCMLFQIFVLFKLEIVHFLKNDAGSVYQAARRACAKGLRQETTFPVRKAGKAWLLLWRPPHFGHLSV